MTDILSLNLARDAVEDMCDDLADLSEKLGLWQVRQNGKTHDQFGAAKSHVATAWRAMQYAVDSLK